MIEPNNLVFHGRTIGNRLHLWFAATRPAFLTASVLPVLVGIALAGWVGEDQPFNPALACLIILNIILIHSGANVLNDYFDAKSGNDGNNHGRIFPFSGGSRFIQNNVLSLNETRRLGTILLTGGILLGIVVALLSDPLVLLIGLIGVLMAFFYSSPPCMVCHGLGDIAIALCFGILPVIGTSVIFLGTIHPHAWWVGAIIGCFVAAILWLNAIPDIDADRSAGKLTLPARLGKDNAVYGLPIWFLAGFILLLASPLLTGCLLALLAIMPAAFASITLMRRKMIPAIPLTLITHNSVCILLFTGYILG